MDSYKLTRQEQETIILFNEAEQTAEISTCNGVLIRRLDSILQARPEEITLVRADKYGKTYTFPKKWVKINPKRPSQDLTDEQRKAIGERLKKSRNQK